MTDNPNFAKELMLQMFYKRPAVLQSENAIFMSAQKEIIISAWNDFRNDQNSGRVDREFLNYYYQLDSNCRWDEFWKRVAEAHVKMPGVNRWERPRLDEMIERNDDWSIPIAVRMEPGLIKDVSTSLKIGAGTSPCVVVGDDNFRNKVTKSIMSGVKHINGEYGTKWHGGVMGVTGVDFVDYIKDVLSEVRARKSGDFDDRVPLHEVALVQNMRGLIDGQSMHELIVLASECGPTSKETSTSLIICMKPDTWIAMTEGGVGVELKQYRTLIGPMSSNHAKELEYNMRVRGLSDLINESSQYSRVVEVDGDYTTAYWLAKV